MNVARTQTETSIAKLIKTVTCVIILAALCFSLLELSEFYVVAIQKNTGGYPWGLLNDNPWYFQSPLVYSAYNLIIGLLLLSMALSGLWALLKKNRKAAILSICATISIFLISLVSANIQ